MNCSLCLWLVISDDVRIERQRSGKIIWSDRTLWALSHFTKTLAAGDRNRHEFFHISISFFLLVFFYFLRLFQTVWSLTINAVQLLRPEITFLRGFCVCRPILIIAFWDLRFCRCERSALKKAYERLWARKTRCRSRARQQETVASFSYEHALFHVVLYLCVGGRGRGRGWRYGGKAPFTRISELSNRLYTTESNNAHCQTVVCIIIENIDQSLFCWFCCCGAGAGGGGERENLKEDFYLKQSNLLKKNFAVELRSQPVFTAVSTSSL